VSLGLGWTASAIFESPDSRAAEAVAGLDSPLPDPPWPRTGRKSREDFGED